MECILTINAGSSSIKFSLYQKSSRPKLLYYGLASNLLNAPIFKIYNHKKQKISERNLPSNDHKSAVSTLVKWIKENEKNIKITSIGHRIVHGGTLYTKPAIITKKVIKDLEQLVSLAPLHQPYNIEAIKITMELFPEAVHVACFDTAFHSTCDSMERIYAIPRKYSKDGVIRYGFHGLSYEYISSVLPQFAGKKADGKVIVAHLGNGASMCAMKKRKSIATTMGFTALEGLVMGTRAGSIDPGIILHLQKHYNLSIKEVEDLLYKKSGMLGISGISNDVEILQKSKEPAAKEALEIFCHRATQQIAMLASSLQGLEVLVFTAGIGENSAIIRKRICELSKWMGIKINNSDNRKNSFLISASTSHVKVYIIPTNEEEMIALHTLQKTT